MQNTDQNDSPPSLKPETEPQREDQPENQPETRTPSEAMDGSVMGTPIKYVGGGVNEATNEAMVGAMGESINGSEAEFVEVNGGSSGQLRSPEEAAEARKKALEGIRGRVEGALQRFGKVTKQSHTVDRLLVCLTPTASMSDRLPFTPVESLHLASRNRDDHILHLAGLIIEAWGVAMRYGTPGALGSVYELQASVVLLVDIVRDRRLFKVYPVDPRSSLFTLRRITDQAKLNKEAAAVEAERDERLGDFPSQGV